jgi:hypothetical protein
MKPSIICLHTLCSVTSAAQEPKGGTVAKGDAFEKRARLRGGIDVTLLQGRELSHS